MSLAKDIVSWLGNVDPIPTGYTGEIRRDDGTIIWYRDGLYHRMDGPACIDYYGSRWYFNNSLHRTDGPACVWSSREEEHAILHDNIYKNSTILVIII